MTLSFPRAAALAQSIRQRLQALPPASPLLVVEGSTDKRALLPFLLPDVVVVPARGKDMLLGAYALLEPDSLSNCLFVVDCDGETASEWKGRPNLIISENRDIEADLLFELSAFDRLVAEYLGAGLSTPSDVASQAAGLLLQCSELTANLGVLLDSARQRGLRVRVIDGVTGVKRRAAPSDLPSLEAWLSSGHAPNYREVLQDLKGLLAWSDTDLAAVELDARAGEGKSCRAHGRARCIPCRARRYSNGHDLVQAITRALRSRIGELEQTEVERAVRMCADKQLADRWIVAQRVRLWEASASVKYWCA